MMATPELRLRVQDAWDTFDNLQAALDKQGFLADADQKRYEMLKTKLELIKADALVGLSLRQQGPW
jgi:hypothetical protein